MKSSAGFNVARVLHISPAAFGSEGLFGGGERYPFELAKAMSLRVESTFLTFGSAFKEGLAGDLRTVTIPTRFSYRESPLNPISERMIPEIARADVIHLHQWESVTTNAAVVIAKALRKKVFVTDHGGSGKNFWRRLHLGNLVDGMLPVSDFAASFYPELLAKSETIYGGVDTELYAPLNSPATVDISNRGRHALFVGRLLPHKGIDVLIASLPADLKLKVLGRPYDNDFYLNLRRLAAGKSVEFITDADDERVRAETRSARAIVLPSLHFPRNAAAAPKSELLGLTLLEGMSSGCPAVCVRTGGMPEVVNDGRNGFVVEAHDGDSLAGRISTLLQDDVIWAAMADEARRVVVERFSWHAVVSRCLAAYARRDEAEGSRLAAGAANRSG